MKKFLITVLGFALLPILFSCKDKEKNEAAGSFKLLAIVKNVGEKLEVEVIESDYAFGEYWVITPNETKYTDKSGTEINRSDLKNGDKIEITYGGQVMMSFPPQIVASSVKVMN